MRDWALKNALLLAAGLGVLLSTPLRGVLPHLSRDELETLYLLWILMAAIGALKLEGTFTGLARKLEARGGLAPKLVLGTFILAALVTNDVALLATLPLVLALKRRRSELAVLLVIAANAGSALTPFGNPQNLYLYLHYRLDPPAFAAAIWPLPLAFLVALYLLSLRLGPKTAEAPPAASPVRVPWTVGLALLLILGTVLRIFPPPSTLLALPLIALAHPRAFLYVDYELLLTFLAFFLLVDNLEALLPLHLASQHGVFLIAVTLSQLLSNVPTAVFLAPFTDHWRALLWGVNAGGFGTPIASLANLIAFRLFLTEAGPDERRRFLLGYTVGEALALFLAIALFFAFAP